MKRKIICFLLAIFACGLIGTSNVSALTPTREWCFAFDKDTGTITGYRLKNYSFKYCPADVVIPETIDGVTVKSIGNKAFMNDGIVSVVIPNSVTSIGNLAFASNYLSDIAIPNTVTKIGYGAFNDNSFEEIRFFYERTDSDSDGIAEINNTKLISVGMMTDFSGFTEITIPENVTTIGTKAFYGLSNIILDMSKNVTTLEEKALYGTNIGAIDVSDKTKIENFDIDIEQIPYADVIYQRWEYLDADGYVLGYDYDPSMNVASLSSETYYMPELYYAYGTSPAYNKVKLEWDFGGSVHRVEIYKYNPSTKKYEYYTYSTNLYEATLSRGINPGQSYYYKVRAVVTTPDGQKYYSDLSDPIKVTPVLKAPTNVKATKYRSGVAKISWSKVAGADGYALYKYNSSTKKYYYVKSTKYLSTTTSYGLKKGSGAYYKVRAYKIVNGKKVYSNYSSAKYVRV